MGQERKQAHEGQLPLAPGTLVLGVVRQIGELAVQVSLPGQRSGVVEITEVSKQLTRNLDAALKQNRGMGAELDELFFPGEIVPLAVIGTEQDARKAGKRRLHLTARPDAANGGLSGDSLVVGAVVAAAVVSVEDRGYALALGLSGAVKTFGFMPQKDAAAFRKANWGGAAGSDELPVGLTLAVQVQSVERAGKRQTVVCVPVQGDAVLDAAVALGDVRPGMRIRGKVQSVQSGGEGQVSAVQVGFLKVLKGTVDRFHGAAEHAKAGARVEARVLAVSPATKQVWLTLLPHLVQWDANALEAQHSSFEAAASAGACTCRVLRVDSGKGLFVECAAGDPPTTMAGYVHVSRAGSHGKARVNDTIPGRCIGFDVCDGVLQVSLDEAVVAAPAFRYEDLQVGAMVRAKITRIDASGLLTHVSGAVRALVPPLHVSDVALKLPNRKFTVGKVINAQVLAVDAAAKRAYLTSKPALLKSRLPRVLSIEDARVDLVTLGVVVAVLGNGILVQFYSDLRAFVPTAELGLGADETAEERFATGQTVKCRLTYVNAKERRLAGSLVLERTTRASAQQRDGGAVQLGERASATVVAATSTGLVVELGGRRNARASLPAELMDDAERENWPVEGATVDVVTWRRDRDGLVVASKRVLLPARERSDPAAAAAGALIVGVVQKLVDAGVVVELLGGVTAFATLRNLADHFVSRPHDLFVVGQPVLARVLDAEPGRMQLSLKASVVVPLGKGNMRDSDAKILGMVVADILPAVDAVDGESGKDVPRVGHASTGTVAQIQSYGLVVEIDRRWKMLVTAPHLAEGRSLDTYGPGESVTATILAVDSRKRICDASCTVPAVSDASKTGKAVGPTEATVQLVKADWMVVTLASGALGVCNVRQPCQGARVRAFERFKAGATVRVSVSRAREDDGVALCCLLEGAVAPQSKRKRAAESAADAPRTTKSARADSTGVLPAVGDVCDAVVKHVSDSGVFATLSGAHAGVTGRIKICELSDAFVKEWQTLYKTGDAVRVFVLDADPETRRVELSAKQSRVDPSAFAAQGRNPRLELEALRVGQRLDATVRKICDSGLILAVPGTALSGLCHVSEVSDDSTLTAAQVRELYSVGDRVRAAVSKVSLAKNRVSFSLLSSRVLSASESEESEDSIASEDSIVSEEEADEIGGSDAEDVSELDMDSDDSMVSEAEAKEAAAAPELDYKWDADSESEPEADKQEKTAEERAREEDAELEDAPASGTRLDISAALAQTAPTHAETPTDAAPMTEREIRERETQLLDASRTPETADDFERLLLGSLNSSYVWIQYMSFLAAQGDLDGARAVGRRAVSTINFREDQERQNVWVARLNLENALGTPESLANEFNEAVKFNDPKTMHLKLAALCADAGKLRSAADAWKQATKRFARSCKVWVGCAEFYASRGKFEAARALLPRALQSLEARKHVKATLRFALLEMRAMEFERGRTMFEELVGAHPRRADLWNVYLDQELSQRAGRAVSVSHVRRLFERLITLKFSVRNMRQFFKRYLSFEKEHGDATRVAHVKQAAVSYVESL